MTRFSLSSSSDYANASRKLRRSTFFTFCISVLLMVTVVMPAEYGIDLTGIGNALGLKQMGDIKQSLAKEASAEKSNPPQLAQNKIMPPPEQQSTALATDSAIPQSPASKVQEHKMVIVLEPDQGAEIKLEMKKGSRSSYNWVASGGLVNFDAHGNPYNGGKGSNYSYGSGRQVEGDSGTLVAEFDGLHGWFWRNRSKKNVTVTLTTQGEYISIKRAA